MPRDLFLAGALLALALPASAQQDDSAARVDRVFGRWASDTTPGCAVGVSRPGSPMLLRAYGMADLEHGIPNAPATIFEAGSVSKQFTAAAVILLALDGTLSLDDDVRKHVPELPEYDAVITLRHLLTHTSGLRDWGSLADIAGAGRSVRTHDHDHVLDILSRQKALNFTPGTQYSYSNSGYNLLAIIVARVSGMPFAEFSRTRIFEPLGLDDTQWRDDYRRIVKRRASAYAARGNEYVIDRPIEHVHGNGGLLTTVADLLTWNDALAEGRIGGPRFVELMHRTGVLNDGSPIQYASGINVTSYHDEPEISHTGATGGYRAFLARYPERDLGVAVLCNAGNVSPGAVGRQVADGYLGERAVSALTETPRSETPSAWRPTDPAEYAGEYHSSEVETTLHVVAEEGRLLLRRRPAVRASMVAVDEDVFVVAGLGRVRFIREAGRITELSVQQPRVHDLRFERKN
jgi:CubicO group peptidase (beta-lactamase class C family)